MLHLRAIVTGNDVVAIAAEIEDGDGTICQFICHIDLQYRADAVGQDSGLHIGKGLDE